MVSLDDRTYGIKRGKVTTRINEGVTNFELDFLTPLKPDALECGQYVSFEIIDPSQPGQTAVIGGRIQKITRNNKDNNKIYSISGRNEGFFLIKNSFGLSCSLTSQTTFHPYDMLLQILEGTNITIGGGTPAFDDNLEFHTNGNLTGGYCGIWKNKKEAIDSLFKLYAQIKGYNKIRWYIDNENKLRWFETGKNRGNVIEFETKGQEELIEDFTITEDAENIVNQLTGYACNDSISTTQSIQASIEKYGLQVGDNLTDSDIKTQSELNAKVAEELAQKAWPIYTANLKLKKFYDMEIGQQIIFVDDPNYPEILLTCTQKVMEFTPADITTTFDFSTDESAVAPATKADVTKAIVNDAIQSNSANIGTVVDVSDEDCTQLLVRPYGQDTLTNVKSSNSCSNYNVGGLSGGK